MRINDGNPIQIWISETGNLTFSEIGAIRLASKEEFLNADRCVGSIFEALRPGESIKLEEGYFTLDDDLDLLQDWSII